MPAFSLKRTNGDVRNAAHGRVAPEPGSGATSRGNRQDSPSTGNAARRPAAPRRLGAHRLATQRARRAARSTASPATAISAGRARDLVSSSPPRADLPAGSDRRGQSDEPHRRPGTRIPEPASLGTVPQHPPDVGREGGPSTGDVAGGLRAIDRERAPEGMPRGGNLTTDRRELTFCRHPIGAPHCETGRTLPSLESP